MATQEVQNQIHEAKQKLTVDLNEEEEAKLLALESIALKTPSNKIPFDCIFLT